MPLPFHHGRSVSGVAQFHPVSPCAHIPRPCVYLCLRTSHFAPNILFVMKPLWLVLAVCGVSAARHPVVGSVGHGVGSSTALSGRAAAGVPWIEQFHHYLGTTAVIATAATPLLNAKVTHYRYNNNSADLRAWTKYLVEAHRAQAAATPSAPEFDIDAFIDYLVRQETSGRRTCSFSAGPGSTTAMTRSSASSRKSNRSRRRNSPRQSISAARPSRAARCVLATRTTPLLRWHCFLCYS